MPINPQLCLLQCTAGYPAAFDELNLRVITSYRQSFPRAVVRLSSHDNGIAMALAAYILGARIVEKHFTLNHTWKGTDQAFSLESNGFRKLVRDLKRARKALGGGVKHVYASEVTPMSTSPRGGIILSGSEAAEIGSVNEPVFYRIKLLYADGNGWVTCL